MRAEAVWGAPPLSPMGEHTQAHGLMGLRLAGMGQALSASPKASLLTDTTPASSFEGSPGALECLFTVH